MRHWSGQRIWFGWLAALTVAIGAVGVALAPTATLVSLFVLPPALAALLVGPTATATIAALASGCALLVALLSHSFSGPPHGTAFAAVLAVALISTITAHRQYRREATLRKISLVAEAAQATIVRPIPARLGDLSFATVYRSAAEEARIGGDAYAAVTYPGGVRLLVADVRGKGLDAVGLAADVLASFREFASGQVALVEVAHHLERAIGRSLGPEDYVTALLVDFTGDRIGLVSCGHPWPLLRHDGVVSEIVIQHPSPPLGLDVRPSLQTHPFGSGDQLFAFTDGLIEARDRHGVYFDPVGVLRQLPAGVPAAEALDRLVSSLDRHAGGQLGDDLAIVLVEHVGVAVPAAAVDGARLLASQAD